MAHETHPPPLLNGKSHEDDHFFFGKTSFVFNDLNVMLFVKNGDEVGCKSSLYMYLFNAQLPICLWLLFILL